MSFRIGGLVMKYANTTSVPTEKTKSEIEATLMKYGASDFMSGWNDKQAMICFGMKGRRIKFLLPLPDRNAKEFTLGGWEKPRSPEKAYAAWEQGCRQRWRALALAIKAKLEAVECGIASFEEEFLAHIVLPDGQTVGKWMLPQVEHAYANNQMPSLLTA